MAHTWYREDAFLNTKKPASFDPVQPGNIGGIEPKPKTMAGPPEPYVCEIANTDETAKVRTETAKVGDAVNPVATDAAMGKDTSFSPGRQEDGKYEGSPELYQPGDEDANLYSPRDWTATNERN